MAMKRKTAREFYMELKEVAQTPEQVDFLNHQLELLDRKSASKTKTARQVENDNLKEVIISTLTDLEKAVTISELQSVATELAGLSNQRITNLLTQLVKETKIVRTVVKGKAYFSAN